MAEPSRIIDIHTHAFPDFLAERAIQSLEATSYGEEAHLNGTISDLLKSMDRAGIEISVICSIATTPKQVPSITKWSQEIASDRIVPFPSIHPDYADFREEIARIKDLGLKGIKMHPQYQGFNLDEDRAMPIYEALAGHGLILTIHAGFDISFPDDPSASPDKTAKIIERFPELTIIACHFGGWRQWDEVRRHLAGKDLHFETSFTIGDLPDEKILELTHIHGEDKIVFGTDSPWRDQAESVEEMNALLISDEAREKIFHKNAEKLLGL
jgi:predicted TIM-barrel fold metal-dependent hydrolase